MWLLLAALDGRWLRAPARRPWGEIAGRGVAAAVLGGTAFYLVMNILWGRPPAGGRNYAVQFLAWAFAWAPGLIALTAGRQRRPAPPVAASAQNTPASSSTAAADHTSSIAAVDLLARIDRGEPLHILDVRSETEFAAGHVPGAVNVPFTQVLSRLREIPGTAEDEIVVYCGHGPRAYMAATALRAGGRHRILFITGHWAAWQAAGFRVEGSRAKA
jgi:rhodanese-related sulfurtransferase